MMREALRSNQPIGGDWQHSRSLGVNGVGWGGLVDERTERPVG